MHVNRAGQVTVDVVGPSSPVGVEAKEDHRVLGRKQEDAWWNQNFFFKESGENGEWMI